MNKIMISYVLCALLFFSILPWYSLAEEVSTKPTTETTPTTTTENDSAEDTSPEHCKQMVDKLSESEFAALSLTFTPIINRFPELAEDNDKGNDLRHKIFDELFHNVVYYELNKHNTAEEASSASSSSSTTEDKEKTDTTETPAETTTENTDTTTTDKDDKLKLSDPDSHIMDTDVAFSFYFINDLDTKQIEHFNEDNTEGWELTKKSLYTDDQLTCRFEAFTQLLYKIKDDKRTQKEKVRIVQRHMVEQELTMLHEQIAKLEQFQKELNDDETNDDKSSDNLIKNEDKPSPTPVSTPA